MKRSPYILVIALFSFLSGVFAQDEGQSVGRSSDAGVSSGGLRTTARLVADVRSIRPGASFTVGVLLSMKRGWHTYWKNPGESGLPTDVKWSVPKGFEVGEIQWPLPEKHIESGDVMTFGYSDEMMLLADVTAPATVRPGGRVTLKADVTWLECERVCVPGSARVSLTLPVTNETPSPANVDLFTNYRLRLPRPLALLPGVSLTAEKRAAVVEFLLGSPEEAPDGFEQEADFYSEMSEELIVGRTTVRTEDRRTAVSVPLSLSQRTEKPLTLRGILVFKTADGKRQGVQTETPLPAVYVAALPLAGGSPAGAGGILDQAFSVTSAAQQREPLYLYFIFAVIGGLLLNIMPCVLPVIALKVFGLVRMAGDHPGQIRRLGLFFSLGILVSFLVLALLVVILQAAGQQVGWGFQFQEPLFVIAMGAIVFAFGLSLFGVFEIRLPGSAVQGVGNLVAAGPESGKGYAASFSEGVFATILATPCTAPFLGTALGFAFSQPAWVVLTIFVLVAFGMALPYLILTARPAWLRFLPKPGEWMVKVKEFMGFLMMATLLWLLYVLGKQLGMEALLWTGAFLLTIGVACWLVGRFATLTASKRTVSVTWGIALVLVIAGYWFFLEHTLDIRSVIAGTPSASTTSTGIQWKPFSLQGLESDLASDRIVFVDFTAEWCLTCKVNEKTVLASGAVEEAFQKRGIIPIKADWTSRNPDITRLLAKFGRSGVPLYVVFPPGRRAEPIVLPEVITPGTVLEAIERAAGSPQSSQGS